jgi:hypothetical protein
MLRASALAVALVCAPGCLVLSLHPAYDDETIGWDPALLGSWIAEDDRVTLDIERSEWKSYRITYVHPIETAVVTGYLTAIADDRYLDVMPARGEDRGSFLVPVHVVLRVGLAEDRLELTPLSYDWFDDRVRARRPIAGLGVEADQKKNALIVSPTARLRTWLRGQLPTGPMFGASAVFTRKTPEAAIDVFVKAGMR